MNTADQKASYPVPRIVSSITTGFSVVAARPQLMLLPVALDLLLWLGPRLSVNRLLQPSLQSMVLTMSENMPAETAPMTQTFQKIWEELLGRYNLLSTLQTFPIGIPSLMLNRAPVQNPLGPTQAIEIGSYGQALLIILACWVIGLLLGALYFSATAHYSLHPQEPSSLPRLGWQVFQTFGLTVFLMVAALGLSIPIILMASVLALINAGVAQLALMIALFVGIWFLVPLAFTPHGIFAYHQNGLSAIWNSIRLVRSYLPGTGMFLLALLVLYQGLNIVWNMVSEASWIGLIGILGHAAIATSLLAASFIYYRNGIEWMRDLSRLATSQPDSK